MFNSITGNKKDLSSNRGFDWLQQEKKQKRNKPTKIDDEKVVKIFVIISCNPFATHLCTRKRKLSNFDELLVTSQ